jgi:hypothetical protein
MSDERLVYPAHALAPYNPLTPPCNLFSENRSQLSTNRTHNLWITTARVRNLSRKLGLRRNRSILVVKERRCAGGMG